MTFLKSIFNQLYVRNEWADFHKTKKVISSVEHEASDVSQKHEPV